MGGNYGKSVYNQLMDVTERLDAMEPECKKSHKEKKSLNGAVKNLKNKNTRLILTTENAAIRKGNQLLKDDN